MTIEGDRERYIGLYRIFTRIEKTTEYRVIYEMLKEIESRYDEETLRKWIEEE